MQKQMSDAEMLEKINELKLELMKEEGQAVVGGSVSNPGKIRQTRKMIAKMLTTLNKNKKTEGV